MASLSNTVLPEEMKIVDATAGAVTTNGGVTSDWVSLKNCLWAEIVLQFTQAVGHATVITVNQATAVAGTGTKAITQNCLIWANEDTAATDTLVRKTDAKTYTVTNDVKKKQVVIHVDPTFLDINSGFDCLGFSLSDSSQATNFVAGQFLLANAQSKEDVPPAAITN